MKIRRRQRRQSGKGRRRVEGMPAEPSSVQDASRILIVDDDLSVRNVLIALLMRISDEGAQKTQAEIASGVAQPGERPMVPTR